MGHFELEHVKIIWGHSVHKIGLVCLCSMGTGIFTLNKGLFGAFFSKKRGITRIGSSYSETDENLGLRVYDVYIWIILTMNMPRSFWGHSVHFSQKLGCNLKTADCRVKRTKIGTLGV